MFAGRLEAAIKTLGEIGADSSDVIFVGGTVLEVLGLRQAGDIDVIVRSEVREKSNFPDLSDGGRGLFAALNVGQEIQILSNPYRASGISDDQCFDDRLFFEVQGLSGSNIKVALPELEFGKKLFSARVKDQNDIFLLQHWAARETSFRWDLIDPIQLKLNKKGLKTRETVSRRFMKITGRVKHIMLRFVRNPRSLVSAFRRRLEAMGANRIFRPNQLSLSKMDLGTVLQMQFAGGVFRRYDVLLRLHTAEQWASTLSSERGILEGLSNTDNKQRVFGPYGRMQMLRTGVDTSLNFVKLMHSVDVRGFANDRHPITLSPSGALLDGSHRFSLALREGLDDIPVTFSWEANTARDYSRGWFEQRGFDNDLLVSLDYRLEELLVSTGAAFQLIVWPPAYDFIDEILDSLNEEFRVLSVSRHQEIGIFPDLVRKIYDCDDIEAWKIEKKIHSMLQGNSPTELTSASFLVEDPGYRRKVRSGGFLSHRMAQLKEEIRAKYQNYIPNYYHDIIVHIGDNPTMNRHIARTLGLATVRPAAGHLSSSN